MNARLLVLPSLCLGGAALLLAPAPETQAFSKIGGNLGPAQRDVRVFDNFADSTANNNNTPSSQFPGYLGAELAVWKGIVEWGSTLYGDGTGDPQGGNQLGDGGANFDAFWAGNADGIGTTNQNIVSAISSCGGGTLAFTETPISDGWRIRFCDNWTWDDGPATIGSRFDLQGVMAHEYGHALGLGHSATGQATMAPSVSAGSTAIRSIHPDDIAGIQCVYGVASISKPHISSTSADGVDIIISGAGFDPSNNEVWFTPSAITTTGGDPIVKVTGVASVGGNNITVAIPAGAGPGNVAVKIPGGANSSVSNAFPTDLVGDFGTPLHPNVSNVSPSNIPALIPGTMQTIVINGNNLGLTTDVLVDGTPVDPSRYTIVSGVAITLDMPQVGSLGSHTIGVTDGEQTSNFNVNVVAPAGPLLQFASGETLDVVDRDDGVNIIFAGPVGRTLHVYASLSNVSSTNAFVNFGMGNNFTDINKVFTVSIPAKGWTDFDVPTSAIPDPGPSLLAIYLQAFTFTPPAPFPMSNLQSIFVSQ